MTQSESRCPKADVEWEFHVCWRGIPDADMLQNTMQFLKRPYANGLASFRFEEGSP